MELCSSGKQRNEAVHEEVEDQETILKNIFVMENFKCIKKVDPIVQ